MDRKLLLLINQQWTSPALDRSMALLSSFDLWGPVLLVAALALIVRGGFRVRAFLLVALVTVGVTDGVVCHALKHLVARPRPAQVLSEVRLVDFAHTHPRWLALGRAMKITLSHADASTPSRSFPSSHTANTTAAALLVALFFPRWGWSALAVPLGVGYSRLYTGAHWPSDVALSLVLGSGVSLLCMAAAEALWRQLGAWRPAWQGGHPQLLAS